MTTHAADSVDYRLSFPRVVRSEWTKLRSLRSTWWVLGVTALLAVGLAGVIGWATEREREGPPSVDEAVGGALLPVDGVSLVFGVLGALLVTSEYGSGLIRATLTAVPRRLPVLWAKALVLIAATMPVSLVACVGSFMVSQSFVESAYRITLGGPEVLRATLGATVMPVASALLGLGIGAMLRRTAGAVTVYAAALLVIPALLGPALPESIEEAVLPYSPTAAGQAIYEVGGSEAFPWMLSPGAGALVMAGWIALLLAGGAVVLQRRDA